MLAQVLDAGLLSLAPETSCASSADLVVAANSRLQDQAARCLSATHVQSERLDGIVALRHQVEFGRPQGPADMGTIRLPAPAPAAPPLLSSTATPFPTPPHPPSYCPSFPLILCLSLILLLVFPLLSCLLVLLFFHHRRWRRHPHAPDLSLFLCLMASEIFTS